MVDERSQRMLAESQLEEFYHDCFVETQVKHFKSACSAIVSEGDQVVDIGGGCGFFATALSRELGVACRVIDRDRTAVDAALKRGIDAALGDALEPPIAGNERIICFNLVLHHLVGGTIAETESLQTRAMIPWRQSGVRCFVNEYIYDSYISDVSGKLIYLITASSLLSRIASLISKVVPSLRANTFGVGVRFRSAKEWIRLFQDNGWRVEKHILGDEEGVSYARRVLLIRSCRRDSFLLSPAF